MNRFRWTLGVIICSLGLATLLLGGYAVSDDVKLKEAFPNLSFELPLDIQDPRDGSKRLFVVEQTGRIYFFKNRKVVTEKHLFIDLRDRVNSQGYEEGLLGLAFHPDFAKNGYFYVNYTASNPSRTVVARYALSPTDSNMGDLSTETVILEVKQPYANHNGGQLVFGPDGYLYIGMGDGGFAGDPKGNAQNLKSLLGKMLRIDVNSSDRGKPYGIPKDNPFVGNTKGTREEIFAYGLRNPWRFSFDAETGDIWTGDVGQNVIEEVDIIEKGKNYGWNTMEGDKCYNPPIACNPSDLVLPIYSYNHSLGLSVTGGFVYRGENVDNLYGLYVYADFDSGRIWTLQKDPSTKKYGNKLLMSTKLKITSFGVDYKNELYLTAFDGKIYVFDD